MKNTIISQAISLGFDFAQFDDDATVSEMQDSLYEFFNENSDKLPALEDECEVTGHGHRQNVAYGDYASSGEIVDFSENWHKAPDTKVYHSDFLMEKDGIMHNMRLFYYVGETDYNAPDGYYFDSKQGKHVAFETTE